MVITNYFEGFPEIFAVKSVQFSKVFSLCCAYHVSNSVS